MLSVLSEHATQMVWLALYTKSRHEKFIAGELAKKNISSFLPVRKIQRRWSDRTVVIEEPLFSSYLFVQTDVIGQKRVLMTKGAVKFVSAGPNPVTVPDEVIRSLQTVFAHDLEVNPFPYLKEGHRVCVKSGVFKGVEGLIARKDDKKCRLVITIDAIMSSISVEVDSCLVEKV